jgi:deferrochelatase/peroxidase EfeB
LRELVKDEHAGELADPVVETGELGYADLAEDQAPTITVALSAAAYDKLGVTGPQRPQDLVAIPGDVVPGPVGAPPQPPPGDGDILLHIQADDSYVAEHVLRRVERDLIHDFSVLWSELAEQRDGPGASRTTGRALIGFLDGTSNLDPKEQADLALIVVDHTAVGGYPQLPTEAAPGYQPVPGASAAFPTLRPPPVTEDASNDDGSYLAVQVNLINTLPFDRTPIATQERVVGRHKQSGVSLDLPSDGHSPDDPPDFAANPNDVAVPLNAHVRKANPRRANMGDEDRRILRRGYPLIRRDANRLGRGLLFVAFARSLSTQFEFIVRAWLNNPNFPNPGTGADALAQFIAPAISGGYYFAPPLQEPGRPETWWVPPAA